MTSRMRLNATAYLITYLLAATLLRTASSDPTSLAAVQVQDASGRPAPLIYDDIASKTVLADIVLLGTFQPSSLTSFANNPGEGNSGGNIDNFEQSRNYVTIEFNLEKVYKGTFRSTTSSEAMPRKVTIAAFASNLDSSSTSGGTVGDALEGRVSDCAGLAALRANTKYIVFLNGSLVPSVDSAEVAYWILGGAEMWTRKDERIVVGLSCPTCAGIFFIFLVFTCQSMHG